MNNKIKTIREEINRLSSIDNLVCVLLYGSVITDSDRPEDLDGIVIVKNVDSQLTEFFDLLHQHFNKLDFNVYTENEVKSGISYFTREFKLEYLAKGECLYGENIFVEMYSKVADSQYKLSIFIRTVEHLQMARQKYFFGLKNEEEKSKYLKKYFLRITKNILLFYRQHDHTSANQLNDRDLFRQMYELKLFDSEIGFHNLKTSDEIFMKFHYLEKLIYRMKTEV